MSGDTYYSEINLTTLHNPILKGFNPDPSIVRVGEDYYVATSTFEWFPGVQIHHSRDLVNWQLVARPLNRLSQLDMEGLPDSCGVWAPCLTHDDDTFYLVYSIVQDFENLRGNTPNFLVTTQDIRGDWSEPIKLGNYGFDGSLFHDQDGTKWFTSMKVHPEKGKIFGGIVIQEYDPETEKLVGPVTHIFDSTDLGCTEAPHIYQRDSFYYLMLAEGGTEYGHAITLARSKGLMGPYEVHPQNPIITSRGQPEAPLQKAGHGDLVDTPDGRTFCTFLIGRPLTKLGRCTLGRETAITEMEWRDDCWLYAKGGRLPQESIEMPDLQSTNTEEPLRVCDDFDLPEIDINFQSLRKPLDDSWGSTRLRKGFLRLFGQEGLDSLSSQSMVVRRVQAFDIRASTSVAFQPENTGQMAGLVCYYNTQHWLYAYITLDAQKRKVLGISICDKGELTYPLSGLLLANPGPIGLSVHFKKAEVQFSVKEPGKDLSVIGPVLDGSILSDDHVRNEEEKYMPAFTGSLVGICCQDLTGARLPADFDWFDYIELKK